MQDFRIHSVYFDDYNSWDEWHMIPTSRPSIVTPAMVENTVEVPGMNGSLDLSEALTGYPLFNNRSGSITFMFINGYGNWVERRDSVIKKLHGKRMKIRLSDDPNYYYEGRITVGDWTTNRDMSSIDISYNVKPYAIKQYETILTTLSIASGATESLTMHMSDYDITVPVPLTFKYTGSEINQILNLTFVNGELGYAANNVTIEGYEWFGLVTYDDLVASNINGGNVLSLEITNPNAGQATLEIGYFERKL